MLGLHARLPAPRRAVTTRLVPVKDWPLTGVRYHRQRRILELHMNTDEAFQHRGVPLALAVEVVRAKSPRSLQNVLRFHCAGSISPLSFSLYLRLNGLPAFSSDSKNAKALVVLDSTLASALSKSKCTVTGVFRRPFLFSNVKNSTRSRPP